MQDYNPAKVAEQITELIQKEYKELKNLNVMILGKTGVGKSTLVNNMFSEKLAETGVGKPVTDKIHQLSKPDYPLTIFDTPGLELDGKMPLTVCWMTLSVRFRRVSEAAITTRLFIVSGTASRHLRTGLSRRRSIF